ncbi:MAG: type II toxin-antitoxin system VapC family toxin [Alkalinema sp. CAN_BIN05]|nr:type II toxin-antitoxin system VapC family toxin [Alkalinema sp. CAN_BIN05]
MYLIDTCTISELIVKQPSPNVLDWFAKQPPDSLYLSVVTIGEITKGIQKMPKSHRRFDLESWLNHELLVQFQSRIVEVNLATMTIWGELSGRLEAQGRRLPSMDALIAATALKTGFTLVTRNEKDFTGTGVILINPFTE